jgi:hypothetical protein
MVPLGGYFGSPAISSPHSSWWNPAKVASAPSSLLLGFGGQYGQIRYESSEKSRLYQGYGPSLHGGVVAKVSRSSIGASFGLPYTSAGKSADGTDYFLEKGQITIASHTLAVAYPIDDFSMGLSLSFYQGRWQSEVTLDALYDYAQTLQATGLQPDYDDSDLMNPNYSTQINIDGKANGWGVNAGIQRQHGKLNYGISGNYSPTLTFMGPGTLNFGCPPEEDFIARENAQDLGLCDSTLKGDSQHELPLPHRAQIFLNHQLSSRSLLRTAFGTVRWNRYTDFDLILENTTDSEEVRSFVEKSRPWARSLSPSYWITIDYLFKYNQNDFYIRAGVDTPAVQAEFLTPSNSDAIQLISRLGFMHHYSKWTIGVAGNARYRLPRESTSNVFSLSIDDPVLESRYRWPNATGKYSGFIIGIESTFQRHLSTDL